MNMIRTGLGLVVAFLAAQASYAEDPRPKAGALSFGWATESITPPGPVAIAGQYHTRISGDVHDPISVTALALESRDANARIAQVVWVSCDLVGIRRRSVDRIRRLIRESIPDFEPDNLIVSATHTHTAPSITDEFETDLDPYDFAGSWAYRIPTNQPGVIRPLEYLRFMEDKIAVAATRAWKERQPGAISHGLGHVSVARNRRAVYFDGSARLYGDTKDPGFSHTEGTSDDSLDTLFFWRNGRMVGVALALYCPSQSVEGELYLSADFWFDARKALRERYSPELHILPLTGASGDQSPHIQVAKPADAAMLKARNLLYRQEIARRIVNSVDDVLEMARTQMRTNIVLQHRMAEVSLPVWKVSEERFAEAIKTVQSGMNRLHALPSPDYIQWRVQRTMAARYERQKTDPFYACEIHAIRLDDLAMTTSPFELFTDYSLRIKARSPAIQTAVVQLTADCPAYLPTERAVAGGGYSARIDDGVVGPEGGRRLVDETIRILNELWK